MNENMPTVAYYTRSSAPVGLVEEVTTMDSDFQNNPIQTWAAGLHKPQQFVNLQQIQNPMASNRRIVQVIIADTNDNVPLESCVLYKGEEKLTDATDQELFFETNIADKLKEHNEKRVKWLDKDATKRSGRDVYLEPAKIRELKMVVVTSAQL